MIRIAIVDDHPIVREGLASVLEDEPDFQIVASVGSAEELLQALGSARPDIVLMDLELPNVDGIAALERLRTAATNCKTVIFTAFATEENVMRALESGARGYLLKGAPADEVARAIRAVAAGGMHLASEVAGHVVHRTRGAATRATLTERERDVLRLVGEGLSNKQIAARLGVTERTAKFHVGSIMAKLGAENRAQAVALATRRRII